MNDVTGFALLGGFVLFSIFAIGAVCKFMEWLTDHEIEAREKRESECREGDAELWLKLKKAEDNSYFRY